MDHGSIPRIMHVGEYRQGCYQAVEAKEKNHQLTALAEQAESYMYRFDIVNAVKTVRNIFQITHCKKKQEKCIGKGYKPEPFYVVKEYPFIKE